MTRWQLGQINRTRGDDDDDICGGETDGEKSSALRDPKRQGNVLIWCVSCDEYLE